MAVGRIVSMTMDGMIWGAFQRFCFRKGCDNSREGFRALVRETPEFKEIEAALIRKQQAEQRDAEGPEQEANADGGS